MKGCDELEEIKIGDVVVRKSYGSDIIFRVSAKKLGEGGEVVYTLKGVTCRLQADAPESDLASIPLEKFANNI